LKFGIAFQTKGIVGFINGATIPLFAGTTLGRYELGIVTWSQNTAFFPLKLVEILGRVNFPLLSRMQHDPRAFARTLEQSIQICAVVTFFFVALFVGLGPSIVSVMFGNRWVPALPTLYVFAAVLSIGFLAPIIGGALDAIGKPQIVTRLALGWTLLNWIAVVVAMQIKQSALSFSLGYGVHVVVGNLVVVMIVKRLVPDARFFPRLRAGVIASVVTGATGRWLLLGWSRQGPAQLSVSILAAAATFLAVLALFDRTAITELLSLVRRKKDTELGHGSEQNE
jgi:O-antigen/teichoic acid export membrane protein